MFYRVLLFAVLWVTCTSSSDVYFPHNVSRTKPFLSGVAEYRSALTLDWLAAEDQRQREMAGVFTEASVPVQVLVSDCISYSKPASGKVARLMLELLKNLEGDDGIYISELIQALVRSKLLVETSMLDAEPDLDSLVETPAVMMGEPHATFPRILAMIWMAATDPSTVKKNGWCSIRKVAKYLTITKSVVVAKHMRNLDPVVARARFIMEEFIQHVTPNMYAKNLMRTTLLKEFHQKHLLTQPSFKVKSTRISPHAPNLELAKTSSPNVTVDQKSLLENEGSSKPSNDHDHYLISADFANEMKKENKGLNVIFMGFYVEIPRKRKLRTESRVQTWRQSSFQPVIDVETNSHLIVFWANNKPKQDSKQELQVTRNSGLADATN